MPGARCGPWRRGQGGAGVGVGAGAWARGAGAWSRGAGSGCRGVGHGRGGHGTGAGHGCGREAGSAGVGAGARRGAGAEPGARTRARGRGAQGTGEIRRGFPCPQAAKSQTDMRMLPHAKSPAPLRREIHRKKRASEFRKPAGCTRYGETNSSGSTTSPLYLISKWT